MGEVPDKRNESNVIAAISESNSGSLAETAIKVYTDRLDGESVSLLSDWLYRGEYFGSLSIMKYTTDRMLAYNIAGAMDSMFSDSVEGVS